ncbi:MAG: aspartate ammonia-lyase [Firmicutes bacterium]|nr:aspartate ammonia-lyase [Bacillota bacterium]
MESEVLYGEQTKLTARNMTFSDWKLKHFPEFIDAALNIKAACVIANFRAGELSEEKKDAIVAACKELRLGKYRNQFIVDVFHGGGGIGINMNFNEVIANKAGHDVHPVDDVNMNQSTSDFCHTAMRLALIYTTRSLVGVLDSMSETAAAKIEEFKPYTTIARTCWQDGMQVEASALFEGFKQALDFRTEAFNSSFHELRWIIMGYTVIGTGTGASKAYKAEIEQALREYTELPLEMTEKPYVHAQYPYDLVQVSEQIKMLSGILSKLARDVRILSSGPETGLHEWNIPAVQKGSSFFPGKVNPVIPEMMIQCDMLVAGNNSIMQTALSIGEVHLNVWEEMMGFLLLQNVRMLRRATRSFNRRCVAGITLDMETMGRYANASIPLVVKYKEEYGYEKLSERIKREGLKGVVAAIKDSRSKRKDK